MAGILYHIEIPCHCCYIPYLFFQHECYFTVKNVKKTIKASYQNKTICAKGSLKRSIRVNGELELEVKKTKGKGVKDRQLKWTVEDSSVLAFEDMDDGIYDDEMEFVGIKPGKTTVTCTNTANKEKVTFTITVK